MQARLHVGAYDPRGEGPSYVSQRSLHIPVSCSSSCCLQAGRRYIAHASIYHRRVLLSVCQAQAAALRYALGVPDMATVRALEAGIKSSVACSSELRYTKMKYPLYSFSPKHMGL